MPLGGHEGPAGLKRFAYVLDATGSPGGARGSSSYRFRGALGACAWPRDAGLHLGACGMWNFLWRLGVHPRDCTVDALPDAAESILWASLDDEQSAADVERLRDWIARGGRVVACGDPRAWAPVFEWEPWAWTSPENPYAGLACVVPGRAPELLAPARWRFGRGRVSADARTIGSLVAVQGERQTPARATLVPLADAPALVAGAGYCFVNGNAFAAFQSWAQGQDDLQPWLAWRHRLFWLDEWVSSMAELLSSAAALPEDLPRPGIEGLGTTTVVLRHDLDHSRDVSYLDEEVSRGLRATHAVLRDRNTGFWVNALGTHTSHETAFHYSTGGRDWVREGRARLAGRTAAAARPQRELVARHGLLRQVRWARDRGVGVATLHRHLGFLMYPEWVDGMHAVFDAEPEVLGGSSLFRGAVLRWGVDRVDGMHGTMGEWPDAQFPLWLPFKLAHAGLGGQRLRGWETTSVMESEPELVDQLLSHRTPHLPQRVVTLGYHPAHAAGATFHAQGSLGAFRRVLDVIRDHQAGVETLSCVYRRADAAVAGC